MATPFEKTDAYKLGIIDKKGRVLKKMSELTDEKEKRAYTLLDRVIWNIKKMMSFIPGGGSMLAGVAAATALLMKESHETLDEDPKYLKESFEHYQAVDHLPDWLTEQVLKEIYEAAMNPKTDEKLLQKISDMWEKSRMDPRRFKQMLKRERIDDKTLNKANLMSFVHSLTGEEEVEVTEDAPTNAVGTGAIKGTDQFPPFKRKKDMKTEAVDNSLNLLFESEEYSQMAFDEVNDFCTNFGLKVEEFTEDEYIHLVDCLDTFARNMISETLTLTETTIMTEGEVHEIEEGKEREISHAEYHKHGAGKGGKQWSSGQGKQKKYWTHRPEEVEEEEQVEEGKGADYEIYHPTMADALTHAINHAFKKHNFEVDAEEWFQKVNMGPKKPSKGKTNSYSIGGYNAKTGKPERKRLHAQVYGMDSGKFELNYYCEDRTQGEEMITEGTWALPDSPQKVKELERLFTKPIPVKGAPKVLYNLTGDDGLFDLFHQVEKEDGPKGDVRGVVKDFLKKPDVQKFMKKNKVNPNFVNKLKEDTENLVEGQGLDRVKIDQMLRKQRIPAEVMGMKGDDVVIKHKKYGKVMYNPVSDMFTIPSKEGKPLMKVWKKHTGENWKDAVLGNRVIGGGAQKMFNLMKEGVEDSGTPIFVVSPEVYDQCKWGREKYQRWNKIVGEGAGEQKIIEYGKKFPDRPIIVKNSKTEAMQYLRFGQMKSSLKEGHYYEYIGLEQTPE